MQFEKAKFFNRYVLCAIDSFNDIIEFNTLSKSTVNGKVVEFKDVDFTKYYDDFLLELKNNILEYHDIKLIYVYLSIYFKELSKWIRFNIRSNEIIIQNEFETNYLIKLKKNIENYYDKITILVFGIHNNEISTGLTEYYANVVNEESLTFQTMYGFDCIVEDIIEEYKPAFDNRFDYNIMKKECDILSDNNQKIKFINNRLFDLEDWQLKNDHEESYGNLDSEKRMYHTHNYYPLFEKRCSIELRRLRFLISQESDINPLQQNTNLTTEFSFPFVWKAKDTHLLELVTAIYKSDSIGTKDGSSMTRKELIEFFAKIFNIEIKGAESKLSIATNRNEETPYLDKLKRAFSEYISDKNTKLKARQKTT